MPYIVTRSGVLFTDNPVNKNTTVYTPNKQSSKTKDPVPNVPYAYQMHDLNSVFTHWDPKLCKNVVTPNVLPSGDKNKNNGGVDNYGENC